MQIVIEIPEKVYNALTHKEFDASLVVEEMRKSIANGIPLPIGHGDLIDRRELKKDVYTTTEWNGDVHRIIYATSVEEAPTIIEADTEREDE